MYLLYYILKSYKHFTPATYISVRPHAETLSQCSFYSCMVAVEAECKDPAAFKRCGEILLPYPYPHLLSAKALIAFTLRRVCPKYHCSMRSILEKQKICRKTLLQR